MSHRRAAFAQLTFRESRATLRFVCGRSKASFIASASAGMLPAAPSPMRGWLCTGNFKNLNCKTAVLVV